MGELHIWIAGILLIIGSFFVLAAGIGLIRLPDLYSRSHAASKAGSVGSAILLIALAITSEDTSTTTRALAAIVFFLLTAPVSAHLLVKATHDAGFPLWAGSVIDEMPNDALSQVEAQKSSKI